MRAGEKNKALNLGDLIVLSIILDELTRSDNEAEVDEIQEAWKRRQFFEYRRPSDGSLKRLQEQKKREDALREAGKPTLNASIFEIANAKRVNKKR